ncbi:hypothetical protein BKA82DRAFT_2173839 [Pisolithus tinctorius]|nr:hypothetical protein BKA82DRAFT_2173839 [Pisolithus tinctorius]
MLLRQCNFYSSWQCNLRPLKTGQRCSSIKLIPLLSPSITSLPTTYTSYLNDMGIPNGFCPRCGFDLRHVIWHNNSPGTYVYFMHYSEDASTMTFLVGAIWILDTLHVSLTCHSLYYYLITNYGVPMSLEYTVWSFSVSVLVNVLVIFVVQFFFTHKIYCLCRPQLKWLVTAPIIVLVLAHFGFGIVMVSAMFIDEKLSVILQARFYSVTPATAATALVEILITVSLCVLFYDSGSSSAFPRTKRLFHTLIIYAVNRCLLTLLFVIAELSVNVVQQDAWAIGLNFIVGKLYANSLLASLNTRQYLRSQASGTLSDLPPVLSTSQTCPGFRGA